MAGRVGVVLAAAAVAVTAACAADEPRRTAPAERRTTSTSPSVTTSGPTPSSTPGSTPSETPSETPSPEPDRPEPRRSFVSIPAIGLRDFPVVRYRGSPDDAPARSSRTPARWPRPAVRAVAAVPARSATTSSPATV